MVNVAWLFLATIFATETAATLAVAAAVAVAWATVAAVCRLTAASMLCECGV